MKLSYFLLLCCELGLSPICPHPICCIVTMVMSILLNFSVGLGAVRLLMLHHYCKLNGGLSSNVDGHVDNYLLILCSIPLTIIVRLVFNIKKTLLVL